ncbi:hypothetical protein ATO11_01950 [Pseudaestuariivita atlantica]|uniref:Sialidase domain-containing protein n=1 Tax=Pseudaestuariivita atlantica TaxID=1317121 RepID=A0A0L1JVF0_9RHOB|nr:hypothetical protein ATO11_01950 [Pseudaestuariivita atlantica]
MADRPVFETLRKVETPVQGQAQEPFLAASGDMLAMSWLSLDRSGASVRFARMDRAGWSQPVEVARGRDLFLNWADFPSVTFFGETGVALHWLRKSEPRGFAYDIEMSVSDDLGATWSDAFIPHTDRSASQHGFATMSGAPDGTLDLLWLDGRSYDKVGFRDTPDAMQLRAVSVDGSGQLGEDRAVDLQTCSCCQTSSARLGDGSLVVAYRDRTDAEIRDISVVRLADGNWAEPVTVHRDGWEIAGCPVNGPAIVAGGSQVAVAWFTGADDVAKVNVAFSGDGGQSFAAPMRIDVSEPLGRVDALMLEDGSVLVSWLEWEGDDEVLRLCRVVADKGCVASQLLVRNGLSASLNFPRMARMGGDVFLAWTHPLDERRSTVVLVQGTPAALD